MGEAFERIEVSPEHAGFGARVTGTALADPLDVETRDEIGRAFAEYSVLVFPDQPLSLDALERVTGYFGDFGEDPFVEPMPGHPHVIEVRREADEKSIVFGGAWHSDWSFQTTPPAATLLHASVVPPVGGDTHYADTRRAYEALSLSDKERVESLSAIHSASAAYGAEGALARDEHPSSMKILTGESAHGMVEHPIVRTHPVTGRRSLFVNPVYTRGIAGLDPDEAKPLLGELYAHMLQEEFVLRHSWSQDMLVVWDNRTTMHLATGGYEGHSRLLHRTTVAGERPC